MPRIFITIICIFALSATSAGAELLTLQECLSRSTRGSYALAVASHDQKIAAHGIDAARSGFLPRVDFQGGYTVQKEPQAVIIRDFKEKTQDAEYAFFSLSATQTLYDFGRTSARFQRATLIRDAAQQDFAAKKQDLFLQVVEAYYSVLEADKNINAADEEVAQRENHLRIARNLFEQGVVTRNDLLQAEVKLADSRQRSLTARNRRENIWLYLNFLTGQPLEYRAELDSASVFEQEKLDSTAQERALANRPDFAAQKKLVEARVSELDEARSGYYPEIYARAGIDYTENSRVQEQAIMAATVGLKINLFDGLATTSRKRQSVEDLAKSRDSLRMLREQISLELQTALNDTRVAVERIRTMETAIRQGEENLRINQDRYQEQVGTATDVIDAQTLLTQIKTDYYRAVYDSQVAAARVKKALGEL